MRIIRGLGGNGGTFLARALAAMHGVVLLSEVNPLTANLFSFELNPAVQIGRNYNRHRFKKYFSNIVELGSPNLFASYVSELQAQCDEKNLYLVIRDYNYVDFIGVPLTWPTVGKSSLNAALGNEKKNEIVLVRHPLAQFQSLIMHAELKHVLTPRLFLEGACNLLLAFPGVPQCKYEDVFLDFEKALPKITRFLDLPFDSKFMNKLPDTQWVTGHVEGKKAEQPVQAKRLNQSRATELRQLFLSDPNYPRLCELSGYDP